MNVISLIGRKSPLFEEDLLSVEVKLKDLVAKGRFLVIGGAGSGSDA